MIGGGQAHALARPFVFGQGRREETRSLQPTRWEKSKGREEVLKLVEAPSSPTAAADAHEEAEAPREEAEDPQIETQDAEEARSPEGLGSEVQEGGGDEPPHANVVPHHQAKPPKEVPDEACAPVPEEVRPLEAHAAVDPNPPTEPADPPQEAEVPIEEAVGPHSVTRAAEDAQPREEADELADGDRGSEGESPAELGLPMVFDDRPRSDSDLEERAAFDHFDRVAGGCLRSEGGEEEMLEDDSEIEEEQVDHWDHLSRGSGKIMRVHKEYRRNLFVPHEIGLPFPLDRLRNERRTIFQNRQGVGVVIDDDWRRAGAINIGYGEWRGFTIFTRQGHATEQERIYGEGYRSNDDNDDDRTTLADEEGLDRRDDETTSEERSAVGSEVQSHESKYVAPTEEAKQAAEDYVREVEEKFSNAQGGWSNLVKIGNKLVQTAGWVQAAAESLWEVREEQGLMNLKGVDSEEFGLDSSPRLGELSAVSTEVWHGGSLRRTTAKGKGQDAWQCPQTCRTGLCPGGKGCEEAQSFGGGCSTPTVGINDLFSFGGSRQDVAKRVVHDQRTVNQGTSKFWHPPALQPTRAQIARRVMWCKTRAPGVPVLNGLCGEESRKSTTGHTGRRNHGETWRLASTQRCWWMIACWWNLGWACVHG